MKRATYGWLAGWLLFYAVVLPCCLPACLDWLSRPSNGWLGCGVLGLAALAAGVGASLYQAGRALVRYLRAASPPSSSSSTHGRLPIEP